METRVKIQSVVENQLPDFIAEENPLLVDFLKQYYISQEYPSGTADLIQNIDKYIKLDEIFKNVNTCILAADISYNDTTITVSTSTDKNGNILTGTKGFPDKYGILKIDDEIITYTSKTDSTFEGCVRGFSGVTKYSKANSPEELVFSSSTAAQHTVETYEGYAIGPIIHNLSGLFFTEFLNKLKQQFIPGFAERTLDSDLNQNLFIKQGKDFYSSKGTDRSFEILFGALFGEKVEVIKPRNFLFRPSDAGWRRTRDLVVERIEGDPTELLNNTLYQDSIDKYDITEAYGSVTDVEKLSIGNTEYYKLSFDADYNKDLTLDGTLYGEFTVHPKSLVITPVSSGSTTIDVDSTVGFAQSGELSFKYDNGSSGIVSYSSKSITQFFGIASTAITSGIGTAAEIRLDVNAYGYSGVTTSNPIKVRVGSVLKDVIIPQKTYLFSKDDTGRIKSLGISSTTSRRDNWVTNVANTYKISSFELTNISNYTYEVTSYDIHNFKVGDRGLVTKSDGVKTDCDVIAVTAANKFTIRGQGELFSNFTYEVQRKLTKVDSTRYSYLNRYSANIQNTYTNFKNEILVGSPSLPFYNDQYLNPYSRSLTLSGNYSGTEIDVLANDNNAPLDHGFYTGDRIYYQPYVKEETVVDSDGFTGIQTSISKFPELEEGLYFVKRVSASKLSFAKSQSNINNGDFISISGIVTSNVIQDYDFAKKEIRGQNILKEIKEPNNKSGEYITEPGKTGVLVNGVEVLNYKSSDTVFYGSIEDIELVAPGKGYDIITPPSLDIVDSVGSGATGICAVKGSLKRIEIIDGGFDYLDTPFITITGGNGKDASAEINMKSVFHSVSFDATNQGSDGDVFIQAGSATTSLIGFSTYHKFRDYEQVVYTPNKQTALSGLTTGAFYHVGVIDAQTVKLYPKQSDAISGINTVFISGYGVGQQQIKSALKKDVISDIIVSNSGEGYQNKKRTTQTAGVSTSLNVINISSHGYETGETVTYATTGTVIDGLNTSLEYLVKKESNNSFKLAPVGLGTTSKTEYLDSGQYVELSSVGSGVHSFNYPAISAVITGNIGVSTLSNQDFSAQVQPIFRGEIDSVYLTNTGGSYGSDTIVNWDRQPEFFFRSGGSVNGQGSDAEVMVVVNNGKIQEVLVTRNGTGYNAPPDLVINGNGSYATLTPIVEGGQLKEVKVINGGIGYDDTTTITIEPAGSTCELKANLQKWTINLFRKLLDSVTPDDGIITRSDRDDFGLEYCHMYAPRSLRKSVFVRNDGGEIQYGVGDLRISQNTEQTSSWHSPILGWAYDGNPIYGPYGYTTPEGGVARAMQSGYELVSKPNRPPLTTFPQGFFNEDYDFKNSGDLDEHNGRFGVTPEFPNGVYGYFTTIKSTATDTAGSFDGYYQPQFPYVIGTCFYSEPITSNWNSDINQEEFDLNNSGWFRNTLDYQFKSSNSSYDFVFDPDSVRNQTVNIDSVSTGYVESVGILTGGSNYNVGDRVLFDNSLTGGNNAAAKVKSLYSPGISSVSVATTSYDSIEFATLDSVGSVVGFATAPHGLKNNELITVSGLSTYFAHLEGDYTIGIRTDNFVTVLGIGSTNVTGLTTYFYTTGFLDFPFIRENDILGIGNTEKVKVLNIDQVGQRIRVRRAVDGTVGFAYSSSTVLREDPRKFTINTGFKTDYSYSVNKEIYFNPNESVGIGTSAIAGIGSTAVFSMPGLGVTQVFVPYSQIYIPNHGLKTGEKVTYSTHGESGIGCWHPITGITSGTTFTLPQGQDLYVANIGRDFIGISTVKVGLGTTGTFVGVGSTTTQELPFFRNFGTGDYHSFTTKRTVISGEIGQNIVTVSTGSTHGLSLGDELQVKVLPKDTQTITVKYDDDNRRAVYNSVTWAAGDVDTTNDTITLSNHGLKTGDKILYKASSPSGGLTNEALYYVLYYTKDKIRLCKTRYDLTLNIPNYIDITSATIGTICLINPQLDVYRNKIVIFDLSDSTLSSKVGVTSYSAFTFNFYKDPDFNYKFESTGETNKFEVVKSGKIGLESDATVKLFLNEDVPENLYYRLEAVNEDYIADVKKQIVVDTDVTNNNQLNLIDSLYSGTQTVVGLGTTTFKYNIRKYPEVDEYTWTTANSYYTTKSKTAYGSIAEIEVVNGGRKYEFNPGISTVSSAYGKGAILAVNSDSIGEIVKDTIENIGFDYPTDFTLKPSLNLPEILTIEPLTSFQSIGISSGGKNYLTDPDLVVLDGYTGEVIDDVILEYSVGAPQVRIVQNTYGMNNILPTIIPTKNSNGIGINTITYNSSTKKVTAGINTGFSDLFPVAVGDKVLIENTSVGVGSTSKGYNSAAYNYTLFPVTEVNSALGGNTGSIVYDMSDVLEGGEYPGYFDVNTSFGRIIPQKQFPIFDIKLKINDFKEGEVVTTGYKVGNVESWNNKIETLKVATDSDFAVGSILTGETSNTKGRIKSKIDVDSYIELGPYSQVNKGWIYDTGILNNNVQRLPDNDYYQYFSYSLKSKVSYEKWNDPVSSLNHTSGFLKFSDLVVETKADNAGGVFAYDSDAEIIADLIGEGHLSCVYTFDLASEEAVRIGTALVSNQIIFENRVLTDYSESVGNRVLTIDDFSGEFNHKPRATRYAVINSDKLTAYRTRKYFTYVRDKRYTKERQVLLVSLLHDGTNGFINQYARVETHPDLGSFDWNVSGEEGRLQFYPIKYEENNYDVTYVSHDLLSNNSGIGSTALGSIVNINSHYKQMASGTSTATTIVGIASTYRSAKVIVEIGANDGSYYEFDELNLIHDGSTVDMVEYGQLSDNNLSPYGVSGLGTYYSYIDGSRIKIDFTPDSALGVGHSVSAMSISIASSTSTATGVGTAQELSTGLLDSWYTSIGSTSTPGINTIAEYHADSHAAYYVVQVEDVTNNRFEVSEVVACDDDDYNAFTEYGNVQLHTTGLGTIGANNDGSGRNHLTFIPNHNINVQVRVFQNVLSLVKDDMVSSLDFESAKITSSFAEYRGTHSDIKRTFGLLHNELPIFQRFVDASDTDLVSVSDDTITIPDHYFVTGEEINYSWAGAGSTQAISIASTYGPGFGTTSRVPSTVYAVKVNSSAIKLAASPEKALLQEPVVFDISAVGIGTSHSFTSTNQNAKAIVAIDNWFQSPIVGGSVTTTLAKDVSLVDERITFSGITSFFSGNLVQINGEIMKINTVGLGSTNVILVDRPWMGTGLSTHSSGDMIQIIEGNYNIRENKIHFVEAPYGLDPISSDTNAPDDRDWTGIATHSTFQGRTFMRSGKTGTIAETYSNNMIFDDISNEFTGIAKTFSLTKDGGTSATGFSTSNGVILINGVFQGPEGTQPREEDYEMKESAGISSIFFTGTASSVGYDVNTSNVPVGGVIVSVGSTEGFGLQPLVAAGGTAVVSAAGTIQSIGIGTSGSGYRLNIQPTVNVAIQTSSLYAANYTGIGTGQIVNGGITGIAITNPHVFYRPKDISNVGYSSISGLTTVTTHLPHGLQRGENIKLSGIAFTCDYTAPIAISTAAYTSTTGVMTVTTATAHGFNATNKSSVVIFTGLGMTCAIDAGVSTHYYPRGNDYAYNNSLEITNDGTAYTVSDATYAPATGVLTLTVDSHGFSNGDLVRIVDESLIFTCAKDNHATQHSYPRPSDPANNRWLEVSNKTTNTFTVNVTASSNTSAHTFVSASDDGLIKHNGTITVNVGVAGPGDQYAHTFKRASSNAIVSGGNYLHNFVSAGTSCLITGGNYSHTFVSVGVGSITVTGIGSIVPTDATYTPTTGDMVLTVGSGHTYTTSDTVGFNTGSLVFECSMDVGITSHAYPRPTDPVTGVNTSITAVSDDTITVNVGTSSSVFYTPSTATYDGSTGNMVLTIGSHTLRGSSTETITNALYDPNTGIMTCYVGTAKSFTTGDRVKFANNSLTFTCAKDSHATNHTYPRSSDYVSNRWLPITGVSTNTFEVTVLEEGRIPSAYTGIHTFVSATANGLTKAGESVRLLDNGITFRCAMDDYRTLHSYPRPSDPYSNTSISIGATTATTITLNVGISTLVYHNVSAATYDPSEGDLVLTLTGAGSTVHKMIKGTNVAIATESLTFTCARDAHATEHSYPRKPDPTYAGVPIDSVGTTTTFTVNVGTSTVPTFYQGGGKVQAAIVAPRAKNFSASGQDPAESGSPVIRVIDNKNFQVMTGVSTRTHFYARGGKVNKELKVKFDDPLSYSDLDLIYSSESVQGIGTNAKIDVVVGQGSSVIDFEIRNTGYAFGQGEVLTVHTGGTAGIPTDPSLPYKEFQITIQDTFTDSFAGWTLGDLEVLDNFDDQCDGSNRSFPIKLDGNYLTIRAAKGSSIDVQACLLVFINDILQVPGQAYTFSGGSTLKFNEAPKAGDSTKLLYYKGTGDIDVVFKDVLETVKEGDELTLVNEPRDPYNQGYGMLQDDRVVTGINTTDSVNTNPYGGPGITTDDTLLRPVKWCKQTKDKIINGIRIGKDRIHYEPLIQPTAFLIQGVGVGSTCAWVQNAKPFFDPINENNTDLNTYTVEIVSQDSKVSASATANVSTAGTITSVVVGDGGYGYASAPDVVIGSPVGLGTTPGDNQAYATATLSSGVVSAVTIGSTPGSGYTSTNPPEVLIADPIPVRGKATSVTYEGDFGIITGVHTTTVGVASTGLVFDLFIPPDSELRDSDIVGVTTVSGIQTGYYFTVSNSRIGNGVTSLYQDSSVLGIGSTFIDNVYEVAAVSIGVTAAESKTGAGLTAVAKVTVSVQSWNAMSGFGYSSYYGNFSWGKILFGNRSNAKAYNAYTTDGVTGITTGGIVRRLYPLKWKNYS